MDNKKIGIVLIAVCIILAVSAIIIKAREDALIAKVIEEKGTCFLDDGTCLHEDRPSTVYLFVWVFCAALASLGLYLILIEKSQKAIISVLEKQRQVQTEEEKFSILLKGLNEDEKKIIQAVKEQDGITQQTLRLRTGLHKSRLSILLDTMEKKGLIARKEKGKTNQVFLKIAL